MEKIFTKALETNLPRTYAYQSKKEHMMKNLDSNLDNNINFNLDNKQITNKDEPIIDKDEPIIDKDKHCLRTTGKSTVYGQDKPCSNEIDCVCHSPNILTRPADYEEACFIFDMVENLYGVNSDTILSLQKLVTEVIYPNTSNYDFYRLNYNHRFNFYPVAIIRAHNVNDIIETINFSKKTGIPIRARGGAHCYQPASLVNFGIIIDQSPRNKIIEINEKKSTIKIEAGALLGPLVNELSEKNLLIPTGTCVTNGLAGLTLGGGIGFALRKYGLTMDQLVDTTVVLANSNIVEANAVNNCDLFWALRGAGGGNYGVVVDFTFKYYEIPWTTIFTINYKFCDTKKVFKIWQKWAPFTSNKLTSEMDIHNKFQPTIVTGQLLPGKSRESDQKKLFRLLEPLIVLGLHTNISIKTVTLKESYQFFGQGSYARPLFFYNKSDFNFNFLPDKAIDTIIYHMSLLDETQTFHKTEINSLGGNFSKIRSNNTAFPSRKAICWLQYTSLWDISIQEKHNVDWLKKYYAAMRPYFPLKRKYVNALDYDTTRLRALKSYFGPNLPKLISIKSKYDPTNLFRFEQSVPTFEEFDDLIKNELHK